MKWTEYPHVTLPALWLAIGAMAACADNTSLPTFPGADLTVPGAPGTLKATASQDVLTTFTLPNSVSLGLRGDGLYLNASGESQYANGICGISSRIFIDNGGGDAVMYTSDRRYADRKCSNYPRKVYVAGKTNALVEVQLRVQGVDQPGAEIPVGGTADRFMSIIPASGACGRYDLGVNAGGDRVNVTRTGVKTWVVQSKPAPNNRAMCVSDGTGPFPLDVSFTVQGQ